MASYADREAFIPYRRVDLIEMCLQDGLLQGAEGEKFRDFCQILMAYYHFKLHHTLEVLKDNFAPFNPDTDTKVIHTPTQKELRTMRSTLVQTFEQVLQKANYSKLSDADLQLAFEEDALVPLATKVDFDEFEEAVIYYRGDHSTTITQKQFYIRTIEKTFDVYERVVLFLKFKDAAYFEAKGQKVELLPFTPGKIYLSLYKNIPKFDLELLFPNIEVSMTLKDRFLFGIPAIGAAVPVSLKVFPNLGLVIGVVFLLILGPSFVTQWLGVTLEKAQNISLLLTTLMTITIALGGFAVKQYNSYKNKRILFQKAITETLFFRNLENNGGVFHGIIDAAEEEETKEIILIYYHLLTQGKPMTASELDDHIEQWFEEKFAITVDFDINKGIQNLAEIKGVLGEGEKLSPILEAVEGEAYRVCGLDEAQTIIDYVWDNLFQYNI